MDALPDDRGALAKTLVANVPVTVVAIALASGYLAAAGIRFEDVFRVRLLNPFVYVANALFHADWGHFAGNLRLWIPFGVALTWLTSNGHVLGVVLAAQVLASVVSLAIGQFGVGLSVAVLAVAAAALVRAAGLALESASIETVQAGVLAVFAPLGVGFLLIAVVAGGNTSIGHFAHFFGFLFGGAIEAMYVFSDHEDDADDSAIPGRVGP